MLVFAANSEAPFTVLHTLCFTLIEQALSVFLTLIIFNDPWVLPREFNKQVQNYEMFL